MLNGSICLVGYPKLSFCCFIHSDKKVLMKTDGFTSGENKTKVFLNKNLHNFSSVDIVLCNNAGHKMSMIFFNANRYTPNV